ncbi:MAG: DNA mismatch repair protein MutS [Hyphomicrobiales bacterium]
MNNTLAPYQATADGAEHRVTPVMAQYVEIKSANPDCLLFYRMGDFYELFFEDAESASRALGIVLTKRGKHLGQDIPMCGVPIDRADDYLQRLIALGHRVAVCEQMEDPAEARKRGAKSVVRRDVTRLVTPGTITEDRLLDPARSNALLAIARTRNADGSWTYGLASTDISTGRFIVSETSETSLSAEIARIEPREILIPDGILDEASLKNLWRETSTAIAPIARDGFDPASAEKRLTAFYGVASLAGFGALSRAELSAAAAIVAYIERTQLAARPPHAPPVHEASGGLLQIDAATRANLELTRTLAGERQGSLIAAIDRTVTPPGARLLMERIAGPLTDPNEISNRHDSVAFFLANRSLRSEVRTQLKALPDMTRALSRLAMERGGPRDLAAIREALILAARVAGSVRSSAELPTELQGSLQCLEHLNPDLAPALTAALAEELPLQRRDGGFIRQGFLPELDDTWSLRDESRRVIAALQARYAEETGARTLRIKHNNFLGYFVEVPQNFGEILLSPSFSATFIHRQTMQGAMRFSTAELSDLEIRISSAGDKAIGLELAIFEDLSKRVVDEGEHIRLASDALAAIDVAAALADLAEVQRYVRPVMDQSLNFVVSAGRHPVVEVSLSAGGHTFVANDTDLSPPDGHMTGKISLITGPNMAGKSTYLRQNALIAVLAQIGSFVPAREARLGIVDRLFSRVGAADDLARGRSTFMVEMIETAAILNQATDRSLVILDEIGRGTATFDGLSIAWATIEHLHEANRCRALFATHFHELTALVRKLPRLANATMRVTDHHGDVIFLHEVIPGVADRSYGIQVARLAGLPRSVTDRAGIILAELEASDRQAPVARMIDDLPLFSAFNRPIANISAPPSPDPLREALADINPDHLTPKEALDVLYRLVTLREKTCS